MLLAAALRPPLPRHGRGRLAISMQQPAAGVKGYFASRDVLLVERNSVLNTGSAAEELGEFKHEHGSQPLTKKNLKRV